MANSKRVIIGSELDDSKHLELVQLGSMIVVPVSLYGPGGVPASLTAVITGLSTTTLPNPTAVGQPVQASYDKFGRQIVIPATTRDNVGTQTTTISASTGETPIVTGAGGIYNDILLLIISNTSASTNTRIDFRDTVGGAVLFSLESIGGAAPVGFSLGGMAIPQTVAGSTWTATCATSTTDVRIYAVFAKNQ